MRNVVWMPRKGKLGSGTGYTSAFARWRACGPEDVVVAAEGHDLRIDGTTAEPREPVGVDAGAEHRVPRRHLPRSAREAHAGPSRSTMPSTS